MFEAGPDPGDTPKSTGIERPGPQKYRRSVLVNHWLSKPGCVTGWALYGFQVELLILYIKTPPRRAPHNVGPRCLRLL